MPELRAALGTPAALTVIRHLRVLGYRTSYSHRGKYYTLEEVADFDASGLWSHGGVRFSRHGTLVRTCEVLVARSPAGFFAAELAAVVRVPVRAALRNLARQGRVVRVKVSGRFLHLSAEGPASDRQLEARRQGERRSGWKAAAGGVEADAIGAATVLFHSLLDEKQRRLFAGLESLRVGPGGEADVARFLEVDRNTVRRGRLELLSGEVETERVRRRGARDP